MYTLNIKNYIFFKEDDINTDDNIHKKVFFIFKKKLYNKIYNFINGG